MSFLLSNENRWTFLGWQDTDQGPRHVYVYWAGTYAPVDVWSTHFAALEADPDFTLQGFNCEYDGTLVPYSRIQELMAEGMPLTDPTVTSFSLTCPTCATTYHFDKASTLGDAFSGPIGELTWDNLVRANP